MAQGQGHGVVLDDATEGKPSIPASTSQTRVAAVAERGNKRNGDKGVVAAASIVLGNDTIGQGHEETSRTKPHPPPSGAVAQCHVVRFSIAAQESRCGVPQPLFRTTKNRSSPRGAVVPDDIAGDLVDKAITMHLSAEASCKPDVLRFSLGKVSTAHGASAPAAQPVTYREIQKRAITTTGRRGR
ncbi:hypothetical protein CSIM01_03487 [Colletotrichum simmondsii]|uniref:Uncharacterized protein n=1 Tax=Colletotrichum simmondsii TaxID=703756 RepID=A0A135RZA2_9PEZI|nr:hypothetical protein CSIM01_03487 [Colletotrichum simmondsii]